MTITPADAADLIRYISLGNWRTSPRPKTPEEATLMARVWADAFNRYGLELPDLQAAAAAYVSDHGDGPQPSDIVKIARQIRRDRIERDPAAKAAIEDRIDAKISRRELTAPARAPKPRSEAAQRVLDMARNLGKDIPA